MSNEAIGVRSGGAFDPYGYDVRLTSAVASSGGWYGARNAPGGAEDGVGRADGFSRMRSKAARRPARERRRAARGRGLRMLLATSEPPFIIA